MGFLKLWGALWGPHNKDSSIMGCLLGSPYFVQYGSRKVTVIRVIKGEAYVQRGFLRCRSDFHKILAFQRSVGSCNTCLIGSNFRLRSVGSCSRFLMRFRFRVRSGAAIHV